MTARTRGDIGGNFGEAVREFRISSAWKKSAEMGRMVGKGPVRGLPFDIGIFLAARTREFADGSPNRRLGSEGVVRPYAVSE